MSLRAIARWGLIGMLVALAIAMMIPVAMRAAMRPYIRYAPEDVPNAQAALVLGASVVRGKPSPILEERAHTAVALYMMGKVDKILVTGDNGALTHDEVTPVRKYLLAAGVAREDIFLDHAGFDTYSSVYRARDVFAARSLTIVTQDFHLPRALFVARALGLEAYGVVPARSHGNVKDYVREIPASLKAVLDVASKRFPKYLGEILPLSGDGSVTWY